MADAPRIDSLRVACRASGCRVADLLADGELNQIISTVVEAMVGEQWTLLPPGFAALSLSVNLTSELQRLDLNRGADRL